MSQRFHSKQDRVEEEQLRSLTKLFERRGISVRRENLSRGPAFRVKSGDCLLTGLKYVFVDRRLPREQQISVLVDYLVDYDFSLEKEELSSLAKSTRDLLSSRQELQA